jgi:hypothetical protein
VGNEMEEQKINNPLRIKSPFEKAEGEKVTFTKDDVGELNAESLNELEDKDAVRNELNENRDVDTTFRTMTHDKDASTKTDAERLESLSRTPNRDTRNQTLEQDPRNQNTQVLERGTIEEDNLVTTETVTKDPDENTNLGKRMKILREYGNLESNIPLNSEYWDLRNVLDRKY